MSSIASFLSSFLPIAACLACLAPVAAGESRPGDTGPDEPLDPQTRVLDLADLPDMETLIDRLATRRVIFVGETHDRYEQHLDQWAIVHGLHERGRDLALGLECFQQPFQEFLDAFVAGTLTEKEMLRRTDYFERWRYDYRLYRPLLRLARARGIPLIALNLERELTAKVGEGGLEALSEAERARLPEMGEDDAAYLDRVRAAFDLHPQAEKRSFEHFLAVQRLWDEGMAERAADYLRAHPEKTLVILAGSGHLEYGQGIPRRLARRRPELSSAIVLNGAGRDPDPRLADYLLYPRRIELPATGLLGIFLQPAAEGAGVIVRGFTEDSGAAAAGLREQDRIVRVGDEAVGAYADLRIALIASRPGQKIPVEVERPRLLGAPEALRFEVELH